ncbi:hypothetical protein D9M68_720070 [compost metagenome]
MGHQGVVPVPGLDGSRDLRAGRREYRSRAFSFGGRRHHREDFRAGIQARQLPQRQPGTIGDRTDFLGKAGAPGLQRAQAGFAERAHAFGSDAHLGEEIQVERYRLANLPGPGFPDLPSASVRVLGIGHEGMNFHC